MKTALTGILLGMLFCACGSRKSEWNDRQDAKAALAKTDSAINKLNPAAIQMIDKGLREAGDSLTWYEYYVRLGKYHMLMQRPDSMLACIDATIAFVERQKATPRINSLRALAFECKASYYQLYRQDIAIVEQLHRKAYEAARRCDEPEYMPNILANLADAYMVNDDLPRAAALYRRALFLTDSLQLPQSVYGTLYTSLGSIYQNLGDFEQARQYFEKTEQILPQLEPNMQVVAVNNFGNYYYYRQEYREALRKFLQMRQMVEEYEGDNSYDMYLCKINLADVYLNLDSLDISERLVAQAEPFFRQHNVGSGVYYANTIRIGLAVKQGQYARVQEILNQEHISEPIEKNLQKIRNKYLRQYYVKTGNLMAAIQNKDDEDHWLDSIETKRAYMRTSEIIQRFTEDTLALHHRIAIDEKEADARRAYTMALALAALALTLIMALTMRTVSSRKKQLQSEMDILKLRLENARNRITPHFVFNVLNHRLSTTTPQQSDELLTLSKLIRTNLDISRDATVSLEEELDFVSSYIEVERQFLESDFTFNIHLADNVDPSLIRVPSMFVQILAENAIKHGLKGLDRHQQLDISVSLDSNGNTPEKTAIIRVADNGRGFDYRSISRESGGTGLSIIQQTMMALNEQNKKQVIDFNIHNNHDQEGHVIGCEATLSVMQTT